MGKRDRLDVGRNRCNLPAREIRGVNCTGNRVRRKFLAWRMRKTSGATPVFFLSHAFSSLTHQIVFGLRGLRSR